MGLLDDEEFPLTTVLVETRTGRDGRGDTFAPSTERDVFVEDQRQLVRDQRGEQVVSETTLFDRLDQASLYTEGSQVTVHGRPARVIAVKRRELDPDIDHLEIALT